MAMATVNSAVVSSVQPLIVDLNGLKIEVEVAKDAQVVKFQPLADATEIKRNAKFVAVGQRNDNDLAATVVLLNSTANGINPMMMLGGMGGGRGGPRRTRWRPWWPAPRGRGPRLPHRPRLRQPLTTNGQAAIQDNNRVTRVTDEKQAVALSHCGPSGEGIAVAPNRL